MKRINFLLIAVLMLVLQSGCSSEPRSITLHKPGVYKGDKDQLLALKNQQELIDRVMLGQTDR
ncbi:MAG: hypothetical protein AB2L12_04285 [Smithellaceae bacterium]